jgi:ABC-type enterochelin transport system substrate-binding protein
MPRVLMPGESDITAAAEKEEAREVIQRSMEATLSKHNTALLIMLKQMMIGVFGPGMEKMLKQASP